MNEGQKKGVFLLLTLILLCALSFLWLSFDSVIREAKGFVLLAAAVVALVVLILVLQLYRFSFPDDTYNRTFLLLLILEKENVRRALLGLNLLLVVSLGFYGVG